MLDVTLLDNWHYIFIILFDTYIYGCLLYNNTNVLVYVQCFMLLRFYCLSFFTLSIRRVRGH